MFHAEPTSIRLRAVVVVAMALSAVAYAQNSSNAGGASASTQTPAESPRAGEWVCITDTEFGYELTVPADWRYDQTRAPAADGAIGVFRGVGPNADRTLEIFVYRGQRVTNFDKWSLGYSEHLRRRSGVREYSTRTCAVALRPATRIGVTVPEQGIPRRAEHLAVFVDPLTVMVLVYTAPPTPDNAAAAELDRMAGTLRFAAPPVDPAATDEALRRGRALISVLRQHASEAEIPAETGYYLLKIDGEPAGYFTRRTSRASRDAHVAGGPSVPRPGLQLFEQTWTFSKDGTARLVAIDAFASFDGRTEFLEERVVQIPPAEYANLRPLIRLDQCVREGDQLVSSVSRNLEQDLPTPRPPMTLDANYLSRAWVALLPALLAEVVDEPHMFTCYDAKVRGMQGYTITSLGTELLPGSEDSVNVFELREGFDGPATKLWTTPTGKIIRRESGTAVLELSTQTEIDRQFGARQRAAEKRLYEQRPASPPAGK
jgi:hypothetical protein